VDSRTYTIIAVVAGALLVIGVAAWALGGFGRAEPDMVIDLPNVEVNPPREPVPG
jgi:hypothetical protein